MREIIGYVPIQPDGSVRVKVPANVALAISVLDKTAAAGRATGTRAGYASLPVRRSRVTAVMTMTVAARTDISRTRCRSTRAP